MKHTKIKSAVKESLNTNANELTTEGDAKRKIEDINGRLAAIVQYSEDAIISKTLEGIVTSWNPAAEKLFGYTSSEMVGQPITKIIPKDRFNEEADIIKKIQEGEIIKHFETQRVAKEGKVIDISLTISPVKDIKGNIIGASKIARDITEQIEARKKIEKSEEQLLKTTQHFAIATTAAEVGIWSLEIATQTLEWSDLHKKMWGYTELETNLTYEDWHKLIVAEDKETAFAAVARALKTKSLYDVSYRIKRADNGNIRWIKSSGQYFYNDAGAPLTLTGVSIDITEQKKAERALKDSEERLRLATQTSGVGIWEWNLMTNKVRWDAQMFHMYGVTPTADGFVEYETWANALVPEDLAEQERILQDTVKNKGNSKRSFKIFRINDGVLCDIEAIETVRTNAEGEAEWVLGTNMDVTEQKMAVEKIKDSEKQFRNLIFSSPSAIGILQGEDLVITIANEPIIEIWGKGKEIMGKKYFEALPELAEQGYKEVFAQVYQTGIPFNSFETPVTLIQEGKSTLKYYNFILYPQRNINGDIVGIGIIATEVTSQALFNLKIKDSEEKFRLLADQAPMWIWLTDTEVNIFYANAQLLQFVGIDHVSKFTGKTWEKIVHPDDIGLVYTKYNDGATRQASFTFECRIMNAREGRYQWIFLNVVARYEAGVFAGFIGTAINVDEQRKQLEIIKESEERFRSLAQTLPQLVWVTDGQGNAEFASFRWKEYSGIEPGGEMEWREIVHPDDYDNINAAWVNSLTTGNLYTFDVRLKSKDGEYRWHTVKGEPVLDKEGKIVKWVGAFTDIQDQKIIEEKKDEFISIASHEMKTPLTTAKAYLQMLELSLNENDEDSNLFAKKASQSVNRLNELITELLDVSKIRLGKLNYTITSFNFNDMIEGTVENIQLTSQTHTIIKTGRVNDIVTGDKERLQQVVINLLNNAIKYSPGADKVFITIEQEKGIIKVSVKDTGMGMSRQSLNKIFEKYHRIEEHAVHFQGLGIGLFISYEIIQRHHGKLWAESEPGKGSTFYFTIPLDITSPQ